MPIESLESQELTRRGLQYSLRDLFLYFLAITLLISGYTTACSGIFYAYGSFFIVRISPIIVGFLIYLIGSWNRYDMHYPRSPPSTRFIIISILIISSFFLSYLTWAHIRISYSKANYFQPDDWPYPDKIIIKLDRWLNLYYTVGPSQLIFVNNGVLIYTGSIKIRELEDSKIVSRGPPMVEFFIHPIFTLEILIGPFIVAVAWCLGLFAPFRLEWLSKLKSLCKRCLLRR
jgi:hypothetical protein